MPDKTRADYEQLRRIAGQFDNASSDNHRQVQTLRRIVEQLKSGDWVGQNASAFYQEFDGILAPAMTRLVNALTAASRVTHEIAADVQRTEQEIANILKQDESLDQGQAASGGASADSGGASDSDGKGFWGGLWDGVKSVAGGIWEGAKQVGGFVEGFVLGAVDTVQGLWQIVSDPVGTVKGLWYAITHPGEAWDAIKKPFVDDWNSGNYGRALGRGAFELVGLFAGGAGAVGKGGKVASIADKAADIARVADKAADVARVADKAGDAARVADALQDVGQVASGAANAMQELFSIGKGVDIPFDAAKLEKMIPALERMGITVEMSDDIGRMLKARGAAASYMWTEGEPGIIMLRANPSRTEVLEELIHMGQHRKLGWRGIDAVERAQLELAAQHKMIQIGKKIGFTPEEFAHFDDALKYWQGELDRLTQ